MTPGTNYYYRYYVVLNGAKKYSDYFAFKTLGVSFTITYDANGGTNDPSPQTASGSSSTASVVLSSSTPTRDGYAFMGWAKSSEAITATYQPGDTYTGSENVKLYAVWQQSEYTVRYEPNGGSFGITVVEREVGEAYYIANTTPTFSNHTFLGWSTELGGAAMYQPGDMLPVEGNVILYAVWSNTLTFTNYDKYYALGNDYASFGIKIYGEDIYNATNVGCELYDSSHSLLGSCEDPAYREGSCLIHHYTFQQGSSDIDITLTTGIDYSFRYYVVVNGGKFFSNYTSFQLGGGSIAEISWTNMQCFPFKRGAYITINANANRAGTYSAYQLLVWDKSGNVIVNKTDSATDNQQNVNLFYDIYTETGVSLNPSTEYDYQYVVTFDGYEYPLLP